MHIRFTIEAVSISKRLGQALSFISIFLGSQMGLVASLISESPFIPDGFSPPGQNAAQEKRTAPTANQPLEFRGMYEINNTYYFLVSPKNQKDKGRWLSLGKSTEDMTVKEFNSSDEKILVDYNGQTAWLEMADIGSFSGQVANAATTNNSTVNVSSNQRSSSSSVRTPTRRTITRSSTSARTSSVSRTPPPRIRRPLSRNSNKTAPVPPPTTGLPGPTPTSKPPTPPPNFNPGSPPSQIPEDPF